MSGLPAAVRQQATSLKAHLSDPLYRNAYALMLNTGITGVLGLAATIVAARIYDTEVVGYNAALVAAMQLLSAVTQLNLGTVLIRFLPRSGTATRGLLTSAFTIAIACALVVTSVVLFAAHFLAPEGHVLNMSLGLAVGFTLSVAAYSVFNLQDNGLTGLRSSIWIPIENGVFGVLKIVGLIAFVDLFGDLGIFASWAIPLALMLLPVNYLIFRRIVPAHVARTRPTAQEIERNKVVRFIAGDYPGSLFIQASTTLLPILVVSVLNREANAYFFVAQSISTATDLIVLSLASSMTVEAAEDESRITQLTRDVLKHMLKIILPLATVIILAAPLILSLFEANYADNATSLLQLMVLGSVLRTFPMLYGTLSRLEHKTHRIAIITAIQAVILVSGSVLLMPHVGVVGVGWAVVASQVVLSAITAPRVMRAIRG